MVSDSPRLQAVQLHQGARSAVEDLVAVLKVGVVGVEKGREELGQVGLLAVGGRLQHGHGLLGAEGVQLQDDLAGLGPVLPDQVLQVRVLGNGLVLDGQGSWMLSRR